MKVFAIIIGSLAVIVTAILITRVRAEIKYNSDGFKLIIRILFYKMEIPGKKKAYKKGKGQKAKKPEGEHGGKLDNFTELIKLALKIGGKAISKIKIDDMELQLNVASDNPFKTAMMYSGAGSAVGILVPLLENNFNIKKKKISVNPDFVGHEITVVLDAIASIAIGSLIKLGIIFAYHFMKMQTNEIEDKNKKEIENDG
ncbi:MAG: DUF2953 domain-containing protein [Clostridia bacterium]